MAKKKKNCCILGQSRYIEVINSFRDQHFPLTMIYGWCTLMGIEVSKETIIKHFREHYRADPNRPAFVPTCRICASKVSDQFVGHYKSGESKEAIKQWLHKNDVDVEVSAIKNHIQHAALHKAGSEKCDPDFQLSNPLEDEISEDACMGNILAISPTAIDPKSDLQKIIGLKWDRVLKKQKLDASTPSPETRREIESLERSIISFYNLDMSEKGTPKEKQANLVAIMAKQINVALGTMDQKTKTALISTLKPEVEAQPIPTASEKTILSQTISKMVLSQPPTCRSDAIPISPIPKEVIISDE